MYRVRIFIFPNFSHNERTPVSNFVAISSLVLELLKKCRVRYRVGHTVFIITSTNAHITSIKLHYNCSNMFRCPRTIFRELTGCVSDSYKLVKNKIKSSSCYGKMLEQLQYNIILHGYTVHQTMLKPFYYQLMHIMLKKHRVIKTF